MSTPLDTKIVSKLAEILDKNNLTELEYEDEGFRISLIRNPNGGVAPVYAAPQPMAQPVAMPSTHAVVQSVVAQPSEVADYAKHEGAVKSPMVGVVYLSPEPSAATYVKVGDSVKVGDTLCLIEAMKTYNPVKATKAGKVAKIMVASGDPVEYGEALIIIE